MSKILLPIILVMSLIPCCIEVEIAVPGFPNMAHYFHVNEAMIQYVVVVNLIALGMASWFYGPLSESFGRRKILIIANTLMMAGAIGCVFSPSLTWLYISRFIQGLGAAGNAVLVFAIIADVYKGEESVRILGIFNAIFTSLMAVAPIAGGLINRAIGWRGNFLVLAILSTLAWFAQLMFLPETKIERTVLSIKKIARDYYTLMRSIPFMIAATVPSLIYGCYITFVAFGPFLYMNHFGCSILNYTFQQAIIIATFSITSLYVDKLLRILTKEIALKLGLMFCSTGIFGLLTLGITGLATPHLITLMMSCYSIGSAICYPIVFTESMEIFPSMNGIASGFIMGLRTILMACIIWLTSLIFDGGILGVAMILSIVLSIILIAMLTKKNFPMGSITD